MFLVITAPNGAITVFQYSNRETLVRDPANKWTKRINDGLGRLKEVVEDPTGTIGGYTNSSPTNLSTTYGYNARDLLLEVLQGGRNRAFQYDSLGRLLHV